MGSINVFFYDIGKQVPHIQGNRRWVSIWHHYIFTDRKANCQQNSNNHSFFMHNWTCGEDAVFQSECFTFLYLRVVCLFQPQAELSLVLLWWIMLIFFVLIFYVHRSMTYLSVKCQIVYKGIANQRPCQYIDVIDTETACLCTVISLSFSVILHMLSVFSQYSNFCSPQYCVSTSFQNKTSERKNETLFCKSQC